ncbi:hypothetical protein ACO1O0_002110 [Amphichorda felina]
MFRFWASDSRGSKATTPPQESDIASDHQPTAEKTTSATLPLKRPRRDSADDDSLIPKALYKRSRLDDTIQEHVDNAAGVIDGLEDAQDRIGSAFQLQILLKHEEKRLIDARLAQCQAALEQLRRVHLKPYPINCPTPQQMLEISAGKGFALQRPNEPVPCYAPPYGVVDGPYSRHYERWLIPHRDFDGVDYEAQQAPETSRARASFAEGRTTRNSFAETSTSARGRAARGVPALKLQSLSSGQPQRKANAGPCVLKRSDGQTVKLVCLDCHRENFSSTQGFINHCRIAHKRDFKSHDEAAMKSGQPYEASAADAGAVEERAQASASAPVPSSAPAPLQISRQLGTVNTFARADVTYKEACVSLSARISEALGIYNQGKIPRTGLNPAAGALSGEVKAKPGARAASLSETSAETPHLARLMQSRKFSGNLQELIDDAKTKVSLDDITPGEESDDEGSSVSNLSPDAIPARVPVVKRVPARTTKSPAPHTDRQTSSKALAHEMNLSRPSQQSASGHATCDEDVEMEESSLSPNTLVSNNAPSLVSDDGEYDDSDEGSSVSGHSEELEAESVSDVAEITIDEEHESRTLRRASAGVSSAVRLRKEDPKHVTLVSPMTGNRNERRKRKA